jgi:hypothetical protein
MAGALMGKDFVGLNKRLINLEGGWKVRFKKGRGLYWSWDGVPVPVSRRRVGQWTMSPSPAYFITFFK